MKQDLIKVAQASQVFKSSFLGQIYAFSLARDKLHNLAQEDTCLVACPETCPKSWGKSTIPSTSILSYASKALPYTACGRGDATIHTRASELELQVQIHRLFVGRAGEGGSCYSNKLIHQHLPNSPSNPELSRPLPNQSHVQCLLICQE